MCSAGHAGRFSDHVAYFRRASSGGLGGIGLKGRNVNIFSTAGCCSIKHLYKTYFLFGI